MSEIYLLDNLVSPHVRTRFPLAPSCSNSLAHQTIDPSPLVMPSIKSPLFPETPVRSVFSNISTSKLAKHSRSTSTSFRIDGMLVSCASQAFWRVSGPLYAWWNGARCPELVAGSGKQVEVVVMVYQRTGSVYGRSRGRGRFTLSHVPPSKMATSSSPCEKKKKTKKKTKKKERNNAK